MRSACSPSWWALGVYAQRVITPRDGTAGPAPGLARVRHAAAPNRLEALVRNRPKRLQYRPDTLDGFIAGTGLTLDDPASP